MGGFHILQGRQHLLPPPQQQQQDMDAAEGHGDANAGLHIKAQTVTGAEAGDGDGDGDSASGRAVAEWASGAEPSRSSVDPSCNSADSENVSATPSRPSSAPAAARMPLSPPTCARATTEGKAVRGVGGARNAVGMAAMSDPPAWRQSADSESEVEEWCNDGAPRAVEASGGAALGGEAGTTSGCAVAVCGGERAQSPIHMDRRSDWPDRILEEWSWMRPTMADVAFQEECDVAFPLERDTVFQVDRDVEDESMSQLLSGVKLTGETTGKATVSEGKSPLNCTTVEGSNSGSGTPWSSEGKAGVDECPGHGFNDGLKGRLNGGSAERLESLYEGLQGTRTGGGELWKALCSLGCVGGLQSSHTTMSPQRHAQQHAQQQQRSFVDSPPRSDLPTRSWFHQCDSPHPTHTPLPLLLPLSPVPSAPPRPRALHTPCKHSPCRNTPCSNREFKRPRSGISGSPLAGSCRVPLMPGNLPNGTRSSTSGSPGNAFGARLCPGSPVVAAGGGVGGGGSCCPLCVPLSCNTTSARSGFAAAVPAPARASGPPASAPYPAPVPAAVAVNVNATRQRWGHSITAGAAASLSNRSPQCSRSHQPHSDPRVTLPGLPTLKGLPSLPSLPGLPPSPSLSPLSGLAIRASPPALPWCPRLVNPPLATGWSGRSSPARKALGISSAVPLTLEMQLGRLLEQCQQEMQQQHQQRQQQQQQQQQQRRAVAAPPVPTVPPLPTDFEEFWTSLDLHCEDM
ncbi:unnamed protein product [Closterium sp. Naga37s-1]|nr:unnamed protein product [Closterium sp. Naga37s-1]